LVCIRRKLERLKSIEISKFGELYTSMQFTVYIWNNRKKEVKFVKRMIKFLVAVLVIISITTGCRTIEPDSFNPKKLSYNEFYEEEIIVYKSSGWSGMIGEALFERFGTIVGIMNVTPNFSNVGWIAEMGLLHPEDDGAWRKDTKDGEPFAGSYIGELTKISEDKEIYRVKGEFAPSYYKYDNELTPVSEKTDFYLIFKDEKAIVSLEEISDKLISMIFDEESLEGQYYFERWDYE